MQNFLKTRTGWWVVFLAAIVPILYLIYRVASNDLGVEPGVTVLEFLGEAAIVFLLLTLAITPIRKFTGLSVLAKYRRMLGLYCLFYASLHVLSYGLFIVDWYDFFGSLYKRPYVVVGAIAFAILLVLGVTSPKIMLRKLGKTWKKIHKAVYVAGLLVVVHVWWQSRSDFGEPFFYLLVYVALMLTRLKNTQKLVVN